MNIVLIGFRGTGKTTVGEILAKKIGCPHLEIDNLIVKKTGKKISKIFQESGEQYFRKIECQITKEISKKDNCIISCGGGVVLNVENVKNLKKNGLLILLEAQAETIYNRIKNSPRVALTPFSLFDEIKYLLNSRDSYYKKAADHVIDTTNLDKKEVVDKIVAIFEGAKK